MLNDINNILQALESSDPDIRELALDNLGTLKPDNAFNIILPYLLEQDIEVRSAAACNLGEIGDSKAIPYLIEIAKNDSSEKVRAEALSALGDYRDTAILNCLIEEVYRPKNSRLPRQIVARQLQHYDTEKSVNALVTLLKDDDVYVRIWSSDSLYKLNRPRLKTVWETLLDDESEYVYNLAKKAIADFYSATR